MGKGDNSSFPRVSESLIWGSSGIFYVWGLGLDVFL